MAIKTFVLWTVYQPLKCNIVKGQDWEPKHIVQVVPFPRQVPRPGTGLVFCCGCFWWFFFSHSIFFFLRFRRTCLACQVNELLMNWPEKCCWYNINHTSPRRCLIWNCIFPFAQIVLLSSGLLNFLITSKLSKGMISACLLPVVFHWCKEGQCSNPTPVPAHAYQPAELPQGAPGWAWEHLRLLGSGTTSPNTSGGSVWLCTGVAFTVSAL